MVCSITLVLLNISVITDSYSKVIGLVLKRNGVPYYEDVMKIIRPLRYTALHSLLRPDVNIAIDFENGIWYLRNIHKFNEEGDIILENNNEGFCGQLAAYIYKKIKKLFDEKYVIRFVRVAESGFFLAPTASHFVLLITERSFIGTPKTYIIDPSFGRYGNTEDFDDYMYVESINILPILENKIRDALFYMDRSSAILIKNDALVSLAVEKVNNKFDRNNFRISLMKSRRYMFAGRYILSLQRNDGKDEVYENPSLVPRVFDTKDYQALRKRLMEWYNDIKM